MTVGGHREQREHVVDQRGTETSESSGPRRKRAGGGRQSRSSRGGASSAGAAAGKNQQSLVGVEQLQGRYVGGEARGSAAEEHGVGKEALGVEHLVEEVPE